MDRLLFHTNAPWTSSGYGQQVALFAPRLAKHYGVSISAFFGLAFAPMEYEGIMVYPGSGVTDGWGNDTISEHALTEFGELRDGLVISLCDVPKLDAKIWRNLNCASWVPVDHEPGPRAIVNFLSNADSIPIAMSRFGQEMLAELDPLYVPHGIDSEVYKPANKAEVREQFRLPQDAFLVGVVAMNKGNPSRKSLPQVIEAFTALRERHDDAFIYLHCETQGSNEGVNLPSVQESLGLDTSSVRFVDQYTYHFNPHSQEQMASIYSAFDVLLNPSMGEGFGITVLEAQACGVPAIVTDFSAMSEVCGAGWKVGYEPFWTPLDAFQAVPRTEEIVEALEECYRLTSQERAELSQAARDHALRYDADRVLERHWLPVLDEVARRIEDRAPIRA